MDLKAHTTLCPEDLTAAGQDALFQIFEKINCLNSSGLLDINSPSMAAPLDSGYQIL